MYCLIKHCSTHIENIKEGIMKNIFKILCLSAWCLLVMASCKDEEDKGTAPGPVTDVSATAGYGEIILKWKNPTDDNFYYVNIVYDGPEGKKVVKTTSKFSADASGYITDTIDGFVNTNEYVFTLTARHVQGAESSPVETTASPLTPVYQTILSSTTISPDFGGVIFTWDNLEQKEVYLEVTYLSASNIVETRTFDASKSGKGHITYPATDENINFSVVARDKYLNQTDAKQYQSTSLEEDLITKTGWTVPGYEDGTQTETIGYSSQATNEGASPNGRVIAIFDNDKGTFWHARWGSPATVYPHWYIIDFGKEILVSSVEMFRRSGNGAGQKGQQFFTCNEAGVVNLADPTTWNWEDQGEYSFDPSTNDGQKYRLVNNPTARYLKVYFGEKYKGSGNFAMVGEMNIYGQE